MKKIAKTLLGALALCLILFAFNACQDDIVPAETEFQIEKPTYLDNTMTETDPVDEDEGVKPRQ